MRWSGLDTEQIDDAGTAFYDVTINLDAHTETTGKQQPGNRAAGASPATVSILHPHAPFPTLPGKVTRPHATPSHPAHSREICAQKHTLMSQGHHLLTSGPRATEHFQHACPHWAPGIEAALGSKEGRPTWTFSGGAHRWAGCAESIILDLSRAGSAQVPGPLLTKNTHKPSRLPRLWNRAPPGN